MTEIKLTPEYRFVIFVLEEYKSAKGLTGKAALELFDKYDVFSYLEEFYPCLHTFGTKYIIMDVDDYIASREGQMHDDGCSSANMNGTDN